MLERKKCVLLVMPWGLKAEGLDQTNHGMSQFFGAGWYGTQRYLASSDVFLSNTNTKVCILIKLCYSIYTNFY